jgi:hypothetical protein
VLLVAYEQPIRCAIWSHLTVIGLEVMACILSKLLESSVLL